MVDEKGPERRAVDEAAAATLEWLPGRGCIVCFGGAAIDRKYVAHRAIRPGTSNPGTGSLDFGGVARNVAVNLARLEVDASLVSVVGDDPDGRSLVRHLRDLGVDVEAVRVAADQRTAEYVALLEPERSLAVGLADMAIFDQLALADLSRCLVRRRTVDWVFADGNLPVAVLEALVETDVRGSAMLAFDPVSAPKAERLPANLHRIDLLFLNLDEAAAVLGERPGARSPEAALSGLRGRGAREVVLTLGAQGLAYSDPGGRMVRLPAVPADVVDVTGAGDALIAATLASRLAGASPFEACRIGTLAAALTIEQHKTTHPGLSQAGLRDAAGRMPAGPQDTLSNPFGA